MKIPLGNRLKKRLHVEIAYLQDEVVEIIYRIVPEAVLHGGTAIWRCYNGNRFSEDLDFYFEDRDFKEKFSKEAEKHSLSLLKYKTTENNIFSKVSNGTATISVEIALRSVENPVVKIFEKTDGSMIDVLTLDPDRLIVEKINAFLNRKLVRDFYDIYHLAKYVKNKSILREWMEKIEEAGEPVDKENLKNIVYSGAIPSFEQMLKYLKEVSE